MASVSNPPLVVIVGQTASGKSALAMQIAKAHNGEIICADSRTIYKRMNIGTAKPSDADQKEIPHHLIDIVEPSESFSAAKFKKRTFEAITDIAQKNKQPILVGGTGLYVDGILFDYAFLPPVETEERSRLQQLSVAELQEKIREQGIALPENQSNPRHLMRALETNGAVPVKGKLRENTLIIGIEKSKEELVNHIVKRTAEMIEDGLEQEVKVLAATFGWQSPGLSAVGYREWNEYENRDDIIRAINQNSVNYAKRQRTWFRRNPHIVWVKNSAEADALVKSFIQRESSK